MVDEIFSLIIYFITNIFFTCPPSWYMSMVYICLLCNKEYPRKNKLDQHFDTHLNSNKYKCKNCTKSFCRKAHLRRHVAEIHEKSQEFRCTLCNKTFINKVNLNRHLWSQHPSAD
jgi:uncharacterized Zn-finger protein